MMGNKWPIAFAAGLIISGIILAVLVFVNTKAEKVTPPADTDQVLNESHLQQVQKESSGLENFGNLPVTITADDLGRANPFESY